MCGISALLAMNNTYKARWYNSSGCRQRVRYAKNLLPFASSITDCTSSTMHILTHSASCSDLANAWWIPAVVGLDRCGFFVLHPCTGQCRFFSFFMISHPPTVSDRDPKLSTPEVHSALRERAAVTGASSV